MKVLLRRLSRSGGGFAVQVCLQRMTCLPAPLKGMVKRLFFQWLSGHFGVLPDSRQVELRGFEHLLVTVHRCRGQGDQFPSSLGHRGVTRFDPLDLFGCDRLRHGQEKLGLRPDC